VSSNLCQALRPDLSFLAIKGAANPLSDLSQQTFHSESVLHHALHQARELFFGSADVKIF
jgi:hypothetical protein